jgi:hypothetical protein
MLAVLAVQLSQQPLPRIQTQERSGLTQKREEATFITMGSLLI